MSTSTANSSRVAPLRTKKKTIVWMHLKAGHVDLGRVEIELFNDCPLAFENFRALCTGEVHDNETGDQLTYRGTSFLMGTEQYIVGGDITQLGGESSSIYGSTFKSEDVGLQRKFEKKGTVALFSERVGKNDSKFLISLTDRVKWLDGQHVIIGHVVSGLHALYRANEFRDPSTGEIPHDVFVADCGRLRKDKKDTKTPVAIAADDEEESEQEMADGEGDSGKKTAAKGSSSFPPCQLCGAAMKYVRRIHEKGAVRISCKDKTCRFACYVKDEQSSVPFDESLNKHAGPKPPPPQQQKEQGGQEKGEKTDKSDAKQTTSEKKKEASIPKTYTMTDSEDDDDDLSSDDEDEDEDEDEDDEAEERPKKKVRGNEGETLSNKEGEGKDKKKKKRKLKMNRKERRALMKKMLEEQGVAVKEGTATPLREIAEKKGVLVQGPKIQPKKKDKKGRNEEDEGDVTLGKRKKRDNEAGNDGDYEDEDGDDSDGSAFDIEDDEEGESGNDQGDEEEKKKMESILTRYKRTQQSNDVEEEGKSTKSSNAEKKNGPKGEGKISGKHLMEEVLNSHKASAELHSELAKQRQERKQEKQRLREEEGAYKVRKEGHDRGNVRGHVTNDRQGSFKGSRKDSMPERGSESKPFTKKTFKGSEDKGKERGVSQENGEKKKKMRWRDRDRLAAEAANGGSESSVEGKNKGTDKPSAVTAGAVKVGSTVAKVLATKQVDFSKIKSQQKGEKGEKNTNPDKPSSGSGTAVSEAAANAVAKTVNSDWMKKLSKLGKK